MQFFGVRTQGSLSMRLFSRWAAVLGVEGATLEGVDIPLGADRGCYRAAVQDLKENSNIAGALVTTHKLAVVRAAGDLIDRLTPEANLCDEVSALYKRRGQLWGHACDPENCGHALDEFPGIDHWQRHPYAQILSFGAGGAAVALLVYLLMRARSRPQVLQLVDICQDNLDQCRSVAQKLCAGGMKVEYMLNKDPRANDAIVTALPPGSLVINATGMGKDLPGSPITDAVQFPEPTVVWELNYRGERHFLHQAREAGVQTADGWTYFMHGWSSVMSRVYNVPVTPSLFSDFCRVSEPYRVASRNY